jgi:catechol 2,3-dioxygenase-like lactoylglutathione lyase family enzyme
MPLTAFDHVNIRTARLGEMIAWYGEVLGLVPGDRPPFGFPGAWLYLGDAPLVHLVGTPGPMAAGENLTLEHFAFRATGMAAFRAKLDGLGIRHEVTPVPGFPVVQINLFDPDGNHIHVDFDAAEHTG